MISKMAVLAIVASPILMAQELSIEYWRAVPGEIFEGKTVELQWSVKNPVSVQVWVVEPYESLGVFSNASKGTITVRPQKTTKYGLTAYRPGQALQRAYVTVTVVTAPVRCKCICDAPPILFGVAIQDLTVDCECRCESIPGMELQP